MNLAHLQERLNTGTRLAVLPPNAHFYAGLELRLPEDNYYWDGRKRGSNPKHPLLLLQITLSGCGHWIGADGTTVPLPENWGFFAILPSQHTYLLPRKVDASWGFFYIMVRHPYIVTRLATRLSETGPVWNFATDATTQAVQEAAATLAVQGETLREPLDAEAALFAFLFSIERAVEAKRHGGAEIAAQRDQLLEETRRFVENHLTASIGVPDLAKAKNMERSRYSHYFRAVTGETPARFMTQVRLESAARQLAETDATLDTIATETGFADANHLCKVFRRHYHVSPGAYRKQLR